MVLVKEELAERLYRLHLVWKKREAKVVTQYGPDVVTKG